MKDKVNVAVVQMAVAWLDAERNIRQMLELIKTATSERDPDLIVFPELANIGYLKGREREFGKEYIRRAETIPGPTTEALGAAARRHGAYLVVGICQQHPEIPATLYNAAALIGPSGEVLGIHHKVHIPGEEKHYFYPGNTVSVHRTDIGNIAMQVCYDAWFPELARLQALKGAEILAMIFNTPPAACPTTMLLTVASTRAIENKLFALACNRVGSQEQTTYFGGSAVADPFGRIIAQGAENEEQIIFATLDAEMLLTERAYHSVFRDRRPELYAALADPF